MTRRIKILLVGVGGQGVLTAARMLGEAAHAVGERVVVGQIHGMSQRGGSVASSILFGPGSSSFLVGEAHALVAFEPLEALRALPHVGTDTIVVVSRGTIVPYQLTFLGKGYPTVEGIVGSLRAKARDVHVLDGPALVAKTGAIRTLNIVMLGALAGLSILPFGAETLSEQLVTTLPERFLQANRRAFELGLAATRTEEA